LIAGEEREVPVPRTQKYIPSPPAVAPKTESRMFQLMRPVTTEAIA